MSKQPESPHAGLGHVLKVYVPLRSNPGAPPTGSAEVWIPLRGRRDGHRRRTSRSALLHDRLRPAAALGGAARDRRGRLAAPAPPGGGEGGAGALRRADRPAEPHDVQPAGGEDHREQRPPQEHGRRDADGPRPLQGRQRHARPPQRRPAAPADRLSACTACCATARPSPASAATSSRSCCPRSPTARSVVPVVRRVLKVLEEPVVVGGLALQCEGSVGIALFPEHGKTVDSVMRAADVAMYMAKENRSGYEFYDAKSHEHRHDAGRLALIGELRRAMDETELVLYYQPKVNLQHRPRGGRRGARSLAPPRARPALPGRVHPAGRALQPAAPDDALPARLGAAPGERVAHARARRERRR